MPASAGWPALGTSATVIVTEPGALPAARRAVERELAACDLACSRFRDDSELTRLNRAGGRAVRVSRLLFEAIEAALRAAALTAGAVDPTIGEALVIAGYDRDFASLEPKHGALRAVRVPGWRSIMVDRRRSSVTIPKGVRLDLGATAKALAADRAAQAARHACPGSGVLVSLGGDIAVAGPPPGSGWSVRAAEDHRAGEGPLSQVVSIRSGGLATSSTTVRRWGGDRHHLIDPSTGLPSAGPWRTVTVAAGSCLDANIASTAAIILGADAPAWLAERGLPARLIDAGGRVLTVAHWPAEEVAA